MKSRENYERDLATGKLDELKLLSSQEAAGRGVLDLTILAHGLTGDFSQALWHSEFAQQTKVDLNSEMRATIAFALGVGFTRISEYQKARAQFAGLGKHRHSRSRRARYFFYQGTGFFRFFTGDFKKSVDFSSVARKLAAQEKFQFGQMLAEELLAHALVESAQVRQGLKHFRDALAIAHALGNQSWSMTIKLNILLNESQHSIDPETPVRLEWALAQFHPSESHSRNSVKLELANQLILRGRAEEAKRTLDEACDSIYSSGNRRQIALLNFRLAHLMYLRGGAGDALYLLRSAETHLHREVDVALQKKMKGLRLAMENSANSSRWHLKAPYGEDPLGDLFHQVAQKEPGALKTILKNGLYYFLFRFFDLIPGQQVLAFDLLPRGVVVLDCGNIRVHQAGFSNTLRRVVEVLARGFATKENLVWEVWGYQYEPDRHDPLIYTTISKLRMHLGSAGMWIEHDRHGYRLKSGVRVVTGGVKESLSPAVPALHLPMRSDLGIRLHRILRWFDSSAPGLCIDAAMVMENLNVSRATATRDLNELVKRRLLHKVGRARATYYVKGDL